MEIAILPKPVGEAIEYLRKLKFTNYGILAAIIFNLGFKKEIADALAILRKWIDSNYKNNFFGQSDDVDSSSGNENILIKALVNGYQIEPSSEEKVSDLISRLREISRKNDNAIGYGADREIESIKFVLNAFNIKITGVNDQ